MLHQSIKQSVGSKAALISRQAILVGRNSVNRSLRDNSNFFFFFLFRIEILHVPAHTGTIKLLANVGLQCFFSVAPSIPLPRSELEEKVNDFKSNDRILREFPANLKINFPRHRCLLLDLTSNLRYGNCRSANQRKPPM